MGNLFAGLSSGNVALGYYRAGIETAGHNIANAGVEGFSRQRVNASANAPIINGADLIGGGLTIDSITRMRNLFLDAQYRAQLPALGYWETRANNIANLEYFAGEVSSGTFKVVVDNYWSSLENLHKSPDAETTRKILLSSSDAMISSLLETESDFDKYRSDLNSRVVDMVKEANQLIDDIAKICKEISSAQNKGETPNDLMDKRDLMAERLCKLTGASVGSPSLDESDGDYKVYLDGKVLVQGGAQYNCDGTDIKNVRHLVLVPMVGNSSYYDVQVEYDQYDHISDLSVASVIVERNATDPASCSRNGIHELFVERLSNGKTWTVGGAAGILSGGERLDTIYDKNASLGISGSFSLQVGTGGVKVSSNSFLPTGGVVVNAPAGSEPAEYEIRVAAGDFETYVKMTYNSVSSQWEMTTDNGATLLGTSASSDLTVEDIQSAMKRYPQLNVSYNADSQSLEIEAANTEEMRGHVISITDIRGTLASNMGIANKNPAVEITVTETDSLTTIANKINAAYKSDLVGGDDAIYPTNPPGVAPSSPEEWLHANIITEPNGSVYLALVSNVSGEANRINVLPGEVCGANGDFSVAKLLGLVDTRTNSTSYMQFSTDENAATTIEKNDVYVNDAYFIYDGRHFLSESNSFAEARLFKTTDGYGAVIEWNNPAADKLDRFDRGIRLNLNGLNHFYDANGLYSGNEATIIKVDPQITSGEIFAMLESRDDLVLGLQDYLDNLAYRLAIDTNAIHYSGHGVGDSASVTGTAFFEHITARYGASRRLALNEEIVKDDSLIATASGDGNGYSRGVGDGSIAMLMAQLKGEKVFDGGAADFNSYFLSFIADMGTQGYEANYKLEAQQSVADQIQTQRDSVMGVSTDEEMLDIIRFQQGVGAISRYMTALDDMLDRVINGMGRAGL
ncbi:MAG: flagellar hook-associated protein FlgK [Synergistaceae bacterium]|jgi:flagellar hook-associated protein 1 FlgK|nr:flagellar hook-associated protein FlgK [Synergistaceae bacterium]